MAAMLEICIESPAGARAAIAGGADRVELCAALEVGGLTPSDGLAAAVIAAARPAGLPVFAMVRPRPGDFAYDADERALAVREACALVDRGVNGLVFGACRDGAVDMAAAREWIDAVRDHAGRAIPCTFHRAIDLVDDPVAAVEVIAGLGFERVLSSGGAVRAIDGAETLRAMHARAGDSITIMAGSGVTPATAAPLADATGLAEYHASAGRDAGPLDGRVAVLGFASGARRETDAATVAAIRDALNMSTRRR